MPKIPVLSGEKLLKILKRKGFLVLRQKGSHCFVSSIDRRFFSVVPVHGNEDLSKGLVAKILLDLGLVVEDIL